MYRRMALCLFQSLVVILFFPLCLVGGVLCLIDDLHRAVDEVHEIACQ